MGRPRTTGNGKIVKRGDDNEQTARMRALIKQSTKALAKALPRHISAERVERVALTAITMNPKLGICTPGSFMACLLTAAQLGLEVNTPLGQAYLIPRYMAPAKGEQKVWTCTYMTGYQGMIDLAYRSNMVTRIWAKAVYDGDDFDWQEGTSPSIRHKPSSDPAREERPLLYTYGIAQIRDAAPHFEVLPKAKIEKRRLMNEAEKKGYFSPWRQHYEAMALKTALRATLKYAPKSAELVRAEAVESAGETGHMLEAAVDDRVAEALASQGLKITDVADAGPRGSDPAESGQGVIDADDYDGPDDYDEPEGMRVPGED